jgi:hypothetical protein
MTINSTTRKAGPFIGNGSTSAFPFTYKVFQAADLEVVRLDTSTNVETVLTLTSDYNVTLNLDQDSNPGGTVTLTAGALAAGYTLTMTSDVPNLQPTDLTNQGGFYPDVINDALDRATIQIQQLAEEVSRSLKVAVSSNVDATLPPPNPNDLIGWNADANGLVNVDPNSIGTVVAYATAYADVFVGNGVTTSWTLSRPAAVLYNLDVSINGSTQEPGRDYTLNGTTFTMTTPPPLNARVLVKYKEGLPNYEGDSQDVRFVAEAAAAKLRSVRSKLRDWVSLKDFIPEGYDIANNDCSDYLQAAIDASATVYVPKGTYLINKAVNIGLDTLGNKRIYGDGPRSTVIKAGTATARLRNESTHYWIRLENFAFDGSDIATVGISLGVPGGSGGVSALDYLSNLNVYNCNGVCVKMSNTQYNKITDCVISGGTSYGMYLDFYNSSVVQHCVIIDNTVGMFLGSPSTGTARNSAIVSIHECDFYGPYGPGKTPDGYVVMDNVNKVWFTSCTFENEQKFNNALVRLYGSNGAYIVTCDVTFRDCLWIGLPYANDLIHLYSGQRIFFEQCTAIRPSPGNYILNSDLPSYNDVIVKDCFAGNGYTTYNTYYWADSSFTNGPFYDIRSAQTVTKTDYVNRRFGINNDAPAFQYDQANATGVTGILKRLFGGTWSSRGYSSGFLWKVDSVGSDPNRNMVCGLNGGIAYIDGYSGSSTDTYSATSDMQLQLMPSGGTTTTSNLRPNGDNTRALGEAGYRWTTVYAATGTINTSDEREKELREEGIDAAVLRAWGKVSYHQFKFKDAVQKKGNGARWHFGLVAQRVKEAFESEGLDAFAYGVLCYDEWEDEYERIPDGKGNYINGTTLIKPAGNRYGIRYEEALALECAYLRSKLTQE